MQALAAIQEVRPPFHGHHEVEEAFQFISGETLTSVRARKLGEQQVDLLDSV